MSEDLEIKIKKREASLKEEVALKQHSTVNSQGLSSSTFSAKVTPSLRKSLKKERSFFNEKTPDTSAPKLISSRKTKTKNRAKRKQTKPLLADENYSETILDRAVNLIADKLSQLDQSFFQPNSQNRKEAEEELEEFQRLNSLNTQKLLQSKKEEEEEELEEGIKIKTALPETERETVPKIPQEGKGKIRL
ncbi:MAG: hypothetical protein ACOX2O_06290 [Bdellovibrionota bacterium]|jgi:hypothetical protein